MIVLALALLGLLVGSLLGESARLARRVARLELRAVDVLPPEVARQVVADAVARAPRRWGILLAVCPRAAWRPVVVRGARGPRHLPWVTRVGVA